MKQPIEASTSIRAEFTAVCEIFLEDPGVVFRDAYQFGEPPPTRLSRTELSLPLGAGASVHQQVTLRESRPRLVEGGLVLPLTWQATGHERLLPVFEGELKISEARLGTDLRLIGTYTLPLGVVGKLGDGLVGRRLARRSLGTLVQRIGSRLEQEAERCSDSLDRCVPAPVVARVYEHPEIYIG